LARQPYDGTVPSSCLRRRRKRGERIAVIHGQLGFFNAPAALDVQNSRFGQILVDVQGRALYLFAADKTKDSTCYDACATAWPPMIADKAATIDAMHGAIASLTGTTTRKDGAVQVTYNGHPLYYFVGDKKPGEIECQAVVNFGAAWYVVDPNGNAITKS